jgi:hypothetical protein
MFAKTIIDSDAFLEMPQSTQLLYFHLAMRADDDGFVNQPKTIMRVVSAKDDDLKILIIKKFIIPFESGVVVIKHWKIHNYIQNDRYKETKYKEEKAALFVDENNAYTLSHNSLPLVSKTDTQEVDPQVRLGKDSIGKDSLKDMGTNPTKKFIFPTVEEVKEYCQERNNGIDAQHFVDHYTANGWMVGRNKMKDWKASVRTWEKNDKQKNKINITPKIKEMPHPGGVRCD